MLPLKILKKQNLDCTALIAKFLVKKQEWMYKNQPLVRSLYRVGSTLLTPGIMWSSLPFLPPANGTEDASSDYQKIEFATLFYHRRTGYYYDPV